MYGRCSRWTARILVPMLLVPWLALIAATQPASADPACNNGGVYILFARGSQESPAFYAGESKMFVDEVRMRVGVAGIRSDYADLGNLDNDFATTRIIEPDEYPAVWGWNWLAFKLNDGTWRSPGYGRSVEIGTNELVKHLNDRSARCPNEAIVLGGYSQGADVVGWAVERQGYGGLNAHTRSRIAFVALYGDTKFHGRLGAPVGCVDLPWVRGNVPCSGGGGIHGILGARDPYVRTDLIGRMASWCDANDGVCMGKLYAPGSHTNAYTDYWIKASADEVANAAIAKARELGRPDVNQDGAPDVMVVPFIGTGSGKTEVHALDGRSYDRWLQAQPTAASTKPARNGYFLFADYNGDYIPDMYEISLNPASTVDVHIKKGPSYQESLGDWATPARNLSVNNAKVALADKNADGKAELYLFVMDYRSGRINVHILDGNSFSTSKGDFVTLGGAVPTENDELLMGDYNRDGTPDMYLVSLTGTGGKVDIHVLNGAGFNNWLGHFTTPFGACTVRHARVMLGHKNGDGIPDVHFVTYNSNGKMDVHALNGSGFNSWIGQWRTIAGAGSFDTTDLALAG